MNSKSYSLSDSLVCAKARQLWTVISNRSNDTLSSFKASSGWLYRFKTRFGISSKPFQGEGADVSKETIKEFTSKVAPLLAKYHPEQIFNVDETAFGYRINPKSTLTANKKNRRTKLDRSQVTLLLGLLCFTFQFPSSNLF